MAAAIDNERQRIESAGNHFDTWKNRRHVERWGRGLVVCGVGGAEFFFVDAEYDQPENLSGGGDQAE